MPIVDIDILSVERCQREPAALFVFGDNLRRRGKAGQAVIRDCANAVGIPTKHAPSMIGSAFFRDSDLPDVRPVLEQEFARLERHLRDGGLVYWPRAGVGTGLARLPQSAPAIHAWILGRLEDLRAIPQQW